MRNIRRYELFVPVEEMLDLQRALDQAGFDTYHVRGPQRSWVKGELYTEYVYVIDVSAYPDPLVQREFELLETIEGVVAKTGKPIFVSRADLHAETVSENSGYRTLWPENTSPYTPPMPDDLQDTRYEQVVPVSPGPTPPSPKTVDQGEWPGYSQNVPGYQ